MPYRSQGASGLSQGAARISKNFFEDAGAQNLPGAQEGRRTGEFFRTDRLQRWLPATITTVYGFGGALWIVVSDRVLGTVVDSSQTLQVLQTYKGWLFIAVTAVLLYFVLSAACRHILAGRTAAAESLERLYLALGAARGGIWDHDLATGEVYLSDHLKKILGLRQTAIPTSGQLRERVHPDDLDYVRADTRHFFHFPDREHNFCYRVRDSVGDYRWFNVMGRLIQDEAGAPSRIMGVAIDVTDVKNAEERVEQLVSYDALTGLPNRRLFQSQLSAWLDQLDGEDDLLLVGRLDIDRFMGVNNELGSARGDNVLIQIGQRLQSACGAATFVARVGADEFAVLHRNIRSPQDVQNIVEAIEGAISEVFVIDGRRLNLTASFGIAVYPWDGDGPDELMTDADLALDEARKAGGRQVRFYAPGMNETFRKRTQLARDLQIAVQNELLEVYYQPILRLSDCCVIGFEALARWSHAEHGAVSPTVFIPLAEELGLIRRISDIMLRQACAQIALWNTKFQKNFTVNVNLSPYELSSDTLDQDIAGTLETVGLPPSCLELEVTENALMDNIDLAAATLSRLRDLGVSVAIDDFGTGYSSLVALRQLPVSRLKIDRSFVTGYGDDPENTAIVNSIIDLARSLNLSLTAEGVEEEIQATRLKSKGCDAAQGFLFSRPEPAGEIEGSFLVAQALPNSPSPRRDTASSY